MLLSNLQMSGLTHMRGSFSLIHTFICQVAPHIRLKFQQSALGPHASHSELLDVALSIFNIKRLNRNRRILHNLNSKLNSRANICLWHSGLNASHNLWAQDPNPSGTTLQVQQGRTEGTSMPRSEATTGALPYLQAGGVTGRLTVLSAREWVNHQLPPSQDSMPLFPSDSLLTNLLRFAADN